MRQKNGPLQGLFKPVNPAKYLGKIDNIVYRSSWELKMMQMLDMHPAVKRWSSEEIVIPYVSPKDRRKHRYFPDFFIEIVDKDNKQRKILIEVKPLSQVEPPKQGTNKKRFINEMYTWGVNQAKWEAAKRFCEQHNWEFHVVTEKQLGMLV